MKLLTAEEEAEAFKRGWCLEHVWDTRRGWIVQVMPPRGESVADYQALAHGVINRARTGDALSIKALRLVAAGVIPEPKKKKGTK